jgi:hypothetical protein
MCSWSVHQVAQQATSRFHKDPIDLQKPMQKAEIMVATPYSGISDLGWPKFWGIKGWDALGLRTILITHKWPHTDTDPSHSYWIGLIKHKQSFAEQKHASCKWVEIGTTRSALCPVPENTISFSYRFFFIPVLKTDRNFY